MNQKNRKKGFSLIELIVVIAVIAAIAAVIVPSISNFNVEAQRTSDRRNVQLWNQTYLEARAANNSAPVPTIAAASTAVAAYDAQATVGATDINFNAPGFTLAAGTVTFAADTGLVYMNTR